MMSSAIVGWTHLEDERSPKHRGFHSDYEGLSHGLGEHAGVRGDREWTVGDWEWMHSLEDVMQVNGLTDAGAL